MAFARKKSPAVTSASQEICSRLVKLYSAFGRLCEELAEAQRCGDAQQIGLISAARQGLFESLRTIIGKELEPATLREIRDELQSLPGAIKASEIRLEQLEQEAREAVEANLLQVLELVFALGGKFGESGQVGFPDDLTPTVRVAWDRGRKHELPELRQRIGQMRNRLNFQSPLEVTDRANRLTFQAMHQAEGFDLEKHWFPFLEAR